MKKIVFSFILLFGAALFIPQACVAQVVVKSKHKQTTKKVVVKKTNRHRGVTVKSRPAHHHPTRVVVVKPNRPTVIVNRPHHIRKNYVWMEGHWQWSNFYGDYIWIKAKWIRQRRGHHWVSGFWEISLDGFIWVEGCWVR